MGVNAVLSDEEKRETRNERRETRDEKKQR
jgi:hypothetical protein